jgi:hypothetical protein
MRVRFGVGALIAGLPAICLGAGAGVAVAVLPAASASVSAAVSCNPKTDFEYLNRNYAGVWSNWCGEGRVHPLTIIQVRDSTYPYHRVWFRNASGGAWCAWGPKDRPVPPAFRQPATVLISANTASC